MVLKAAAGSAPAARSISKQEAPIPAGSCTTVSNAGRACTASPVRASPPAVGGAAALRRTRTTLQCPAFGSSPDTHRPAADGRSEPMTDSKRDRPEDGASGGLVLRFLRFVEVLGNKLPDPALLFLIALLLTWVASAVFAGVEFSNPRPGAEAPLVIENQLTGGSLVDFLTKMVNVFVTFPPLGVVLVAMLGVGVAEHTGLIGAGLRFLLGFTPRKLLTPVLIFVAIVSHTAADAGYVLVIPLGGVIFYAAGRHPLAGIAAGFAGVSGGFSANFIPSGIDPLLQGLTEAGANLIDPDYDVNVLCNILFTGLSSLPILLVGWYVTDRIVEPRLRDVDVDGDSDEMPQMEALGSREKFALAAAMLSLGVLLLLLVLAVLPSDSPFRSSEGSLTVGAPLMTSIVPLIFFVFLIPGAVYGYVAGTVRNHRDLVKGMSKSMETMGTYLVMAFFAAQFLAAFGDSNLGAFLAVKGAEFLRDLKVAAPVTVAGIVVLTALVNLLVGSASAKWALLAPILVPMLMGVGIAPELTQAAYRVGDSTTNILTPLMPYFPLVVVFCRRYVRGTGIGTVLSMMLPYSVAFFVVWLGFLLLYWKLGLPLGVASTYVYQP